MTDISVVVPVYGCTTTLIELYLRLKASLEEISRNFEIILIDDGGPSLPWPTIVDLAKKDDRVKGYSLSRNFGQHCAISAGLEKSTGEWVVVMDCDLQDRPEEIQNLYKKAVEGFDLVLAKRKNRNDSFLKKQYSALFYRILAYLTNSKQDSEIANFGIYNRKVITAILNMGDSIKYFPAMVRWVGFNSAEIDVEHSERQHGKTSYNLIKSLKLALNTMLSFSDKPLRIAINLGLSISFVSLLMATFYFIKYLNGEIKVLGWPSLIISIWLFSGIIIVILGTVGLYIGKIFEKVKNRPIYIIDKKTTKDGEL